MALTRAKASLAISFVATGPDNVPLSASRFLKALPTGEIETTQHYELLHKTDETGGAPFAQGHAGAGDARAPYTPGRGGGGYTPRVPATPNALPALVVPESEKPRGALAEQLQHWKALDESVRGRRAAKAARAAKAKQGPKGKPKAPTTPAPTKRPKPAGRGGNSGGGPVGVLEVSGGTLAKRRKSDIVDSEDEDDFA